MRPRRPDHPSENHQHVHVTSSDWVTRASLPDDESCLVSTWLKGYAHSLDVSSRYEGIRDELARDRLDNLPKPAFMRFWKVYQPIVTALVRNTEVVVLCDPERSDYADQNRPAVIWAWACFGGPDIVHWICVKRQATQAGLSRDMIRDLLGERIRTRQQTTFELSEPRNSTAHVVKDLTALGALSRDEGGESLWRRDRGWLNLMRRFSLGVLQHDKITTAVGRHILDANRVEWRSGTERAA